MPERARARLFKGWPFCWMRVSVLVGSEGVVREGTSDTEVIPRIEGVPPMPLLLLLILVLVLVLILVLILVLVLVLVLVVHRGGVS